MGVSYNEGYIFFWGVPIIRTTIYWGPYWVPLSWEAATWRAVDSK